MKKKAKSENIVKRLFCTNCYRGSVYPNCWQQPCHTPSQGASQEQASQILCLWASVLYRDLLWASISKMSPKVSETPRRAHKGNKLSIKLDIAKHSECGEWNTDIVHASNLPASTIRTIYTQRGKVLKAEVTVGSSNRKVISFTWHLVRGKMERLLLKWTGGHAKRGVYLSYHSGFYYRLVWFQALYVIWYDSVGYFWVWERLKMVSSLKPFLLVNSFIGTLYLSIVEGTWIKHKILFLAFDRIDVPFRLKTK